MTSAVMDDDGDADYDEGEKPEATIQSSETIEVEPYTPHISGEGEWLLGDINLGASIQCSINPERDLSTAQRARQILRNGGTIRVKSHSSFPDDAMVRFQDTKLGLDDC